MASFLKGLVAVLFFAIVLWFTIDKNPKDFLVIGIITIVVLIAENFVKKIVKSKEKNSSVQGIKMEKWERVALIFIPAFALFIALIFSILDFGFTTNTKHLEATKVSVSSDWATVEVRTKIPSTVVTGWEYIVDGENLTISVSTSLVSPMHTENPISFSFPDSEMDKVKRVYLEGRNENDRKLIWEKN